MRGNTNVCGGKKKNFNVSWCVHSLVELVRRTSFYFSYCWCNMDARAIEYMCVLQTLVHNFSNKIKE